jgi:DNA-binding MarR family transcriptional regulator
MRKSGALKGQALIALDLVKQFPGRSSKELAKLGSLDRYQIARRLPELLEMKHVTRTQSDDKDCLWWPV